MFNPDISLFLCKIALALGLALVFLSSWGISRFAPLAERPDIRRIKALEADVAYLHDENERLLQQMADNRGGPKFNNPLEDSPIEFGADFESDDEVTVVQIARLEKEADNTDVAPTRFDFFGVRKSADAKEEKRTNTEEVQAFQKLKAFEQAENYPEMIELATTQIMKSPEWLTPYLFRGAAYYNLGQPEKAVSDLKYVAARAGDDPAYAIATRILEKISPISSVSIAQ